MFARRVLFGALAAALLAALVIVPVPAAHADSWLYFVSASTTCQEGTFSFRAGESGSPALSGPTLSGPNVLVEVVDGQGTLLGTKEYSVPYTGGLYHGTIGYSQTPVESVTFELYAYPQVSPGMTGASQLPARLYLADTVTIPDPCASPGCDQLIPMDGAVMGLFRADAPAYSVPGQLVMPPVTIQAGKTLYVFGQDASEQYYQVLLVCTFLWVPKNTLAPDPEPLWHSTPLPTTIVQ
jgi:hypothetical protein